MPPNRNYKFEKRQKDLAKMKKKEEKKQRQLAKKQASQDENGVAVAENEENNAVTD
ncbi:hypothetical protein [Maridesulfovibrio ferrireducens]|uniref:hypothetical protein n=1 Tax=Maridesulfovibrio ferrireducens TaxID=246191 RepID=UPI001A2CFAB3|nr:hypothetical protein [Maridesulfovibrio ferrireducens]MBI9111660.1 hypothetical protein [Maridesulfovibrio ferrireducens]